jgi:L-alanine-DL-glutamate epimerase-like enolase superfamily enzyme
MPSGLTLHASVHRPGASPGDPTPYAGSDSFTFVHVQVRDADGATGHGFTGRFLAPEVAGFLNRAVAEALPGDTVDPVSHLMRDYNPRGMTGVVVSALSALEIALTDLSAKREGISVAALLGGARNSAPVHVTCGFPALDTDDLVEVCGKEIAAGAKGVKVLVAARGRSVAEDAARLRAVRDAIGDEADLVADANCAMDVETAIDLAAATADLDLAWLEEPVHGNDRHALAQLASQAAIPLGAGQMEQSAERFALLAEAGVSVLQPNATFCGGFNSAVRIARNATAQARTVSPGGGWDILNLHWMCGALETGEVELHRAQTRITRLLLPEPPVISDGHLHVPDVPGLGLDPDFEALERCRLL